MPNPSSLVEVSLINPAPRHVVQVLVMRHGKKEGSEENAPLTDEGRRQIADAAEQYLAGERIHALFASTLDRARETAAIAYESAYSLDPHTGILPVEQREELGFVGLPLHEYADAAAKAKGSPPGETQDREDERRKT